MKKREKSKKNTIALRGGAYSIVMTVVVLAILFVCNILSTALPATLTKLDISSSKLYSITSNTKAVVNNLTQDVTIYWIVQANEEDDIITNLLAKYDSLSDHIEVVKKNPDVYPTFAAQYTDETVANNSLIVESGDRSRYISYDDIYVQDTSSYYSYYYSSSANYSFDGEGAITSAIDYVVNEDLPKIYTLEGHGESDLPTSFSEQITKSNIEVASLSLMSEEEIPEDCDVIMIYAPSTDLSEEEVTMLNEYTAAGGKLFVVSGSLKENTVTDLPNLNSILSAYGVETLEGVVADIGNGYYAYGSPYYLMPALAEDDITTPLSEESYHVIMPAAQALVVSGSSVTTLLTTSEESYNKESDYNTTYEKEDGDAEGPFALGVSIDCGNDGQIIWFSSSWFLEDYYNSFSSSANVKLAMNAISSLVGETETLAIPSKSLSYNYLTISESTASLLKVLLIGVFPLAYLGIGLVVFANRRREQNVTV